MINYPSSIRVGSINSIKAFIVGFAGFKRGIILVNLL